MLSLSLSPPREHDLFLSAGGTLMINSSSHLYYFSLIETTKIFTFIQLLFIVGLKLKKLMHSKIIKFLDNLTKWYFAHSRTLSIYVLAFIKLIFIVKLKFKKLIHFKIIKLLDNLTKWYFTHAWVLSIYVMFLLGPHRSKDETSGAGGKIKERTPS